MKLWKSTMALAGLAGLSLSLRCDGRLGTPPSVRSELGAVLRGSRSFEGLLVGLPLPPFLAMSPVAPLGDDASPIVLRIEQAAERRGTPRDLADLAAAALISGDPDRAVDLLEEASRLSPEDASILSDLSASYLARADRGGEVFSDRMRSLSAAIRALDQKPQLREAICNRALARERLFLAARGLAKESCRTDGEKEAAGDVALAPTGVSVPPSAGDMLRKAARAGDAAEARRIVARSPRKGRDVGEELLASWAEAHLAGETDEARGSLAAARSVGDALWEISGDALLRDTCSSIEKASGRQVLDLIARGIARYREGWRLYTEWKLVLAARALRESRDALAATRCPFEARSLYTLALTDAFGGYSDRALGTFSRVEKRAKEARYPGLLAESLWMSGLSQLSRGNLDAALAAYRRSIEVYEAYGDWDGVAGARAILAELLDDLGDSSEAGRHRLAALEQTARIDGPQRLYQIYTVAAMAAFQENLPEVALEFQNEVVRHAERVTPLARSQALCWRSRYWQKLGRAGRAIEDLREARRWTLELPDPSARDWAEGDLLLAEAEIRLSSAPQESIQLLSDLLVRSAKVRDEAYRFEALRLRAQAYRSLGRSREEETDLRASIQIVDNLRSTIEDPNLKNTFFDGLQEVFDEMIFLQVEVKKDPRAAFDYLERKRARVLLEQMLKTADPASAAAERARRSIAPRSIESLRKELPEQTVVLSYARARDGLLIWVIDRTGIRAFRHLDKASRLDELARRIVRKVQDESRSNRGIDAAGQDLFDVLIRPVADAIPTGARLVLVRNDVLSGIPFALLRDRKTGRYLMEDHVLSSAHSVNSYAASLRRSRELGSESPSRPLVVGDPDFDTKLFPRLQPLAGALREAESIAPFYPGGDLLTRAAATKDAFLAGLLDHDLVQFSGHASDSSLVLAPSPGRDGVLHAQEVFGLRQGRARLVILAACGSAEGPASSSEGIESLSRAFLAAGVPAVIGTLWDIPDEASTEMLLELHRNLRRGMDPAAALQAAQLRLLRSDNTTWRSPLVWAAFELAGGYAETQGRASWTPSR